MVNVMNMMQVNRIAPPQRMATDLNYEADLKAALEPILVELLDITAAAGWDRRKAASAIMFLAAQNLTDGKSRAGSGGRTN
jgi:hypothetical protein